ncbi:MAG: outer membrane lipoprotein-sorting protein [Planctomycetes bacterium]|nr:outer membrane lipoprotein-sorting protein [Planctomycetota bacterium]
MRPAENIEKLLKDINIDTNAKTDDAVLDDVIEAFEKSKDKKTSAIEQNIWRIIMKSPIIKLAAAAVIVLAVVFSMTIFDKSVPTAYAIEQTIQASHSVQYLHIRAITLSHEDQPVEFWIEFAQDGQPKNMRLNLPDWMAPGSGPREVIWQGSTKQEWLREKNILTTTEDEASATQILKMIENLDPKLAVTRLQEKQEQGKVELEINESADKAEPIIVTATSTKEDDSSFQRKILYIDQATRLVNVIELYKLRNGEYKYMKTMEFYDYNQPIDAKMFMFKDVSNDAEHIDLMTIGLAQDNLSDEEIAVEVVRQFLEALIDGNYDKASKLFPGVPADEIKEMFGEINIIRIVSMGKPILHSETNRLRVPYELEVEMEGKKSLWKQQGPLVQHLAGQPDRWAIMGGF